jgi:hypothetical protein
MKGTTTKVQVGTLEFDGVMLYDGSYGITMTQFTEMTGFNTSKNTQSRGLKRLL